MRDKGANTGGGIKLLTVILIAANLLMLVIAVVTIPPNFLGRAKRVNIPSIPDSLEQEFAEIDAQSSAPADAPKTSAESHAQEIKSADLPKEQRVTWEDFQWYTEGVFQKGIPEGVESINAFDAVKGSWKAFIAHDPKNEFAENALEILYVNISGDADSARLTARWYLYHNMNENKRINQEDMDDAVYEGKWENGGMWASGPGTIRLTNFYKLNNTQYAIGTIDTVDGIPAFIALVRE